MSIFDDIRKDAEAGTQNWLFVPDDEFGEPAVSIIDQNGTGFDIATLWGGYIAGEIDARRIARVPQLEAIALAALDPDWIAQRIREIDGDHTKGAGQIGEELAAAFREATE